MANSDNLKPIRTKSEARERGKNGGKKSGAARRKKKTLRELIDAFGTARVSIPGIEEEMMKLGMELDEMTNDMALVVGQYASAIKGKTDAATWIRDTKGEKPHDVLETPDIVYKPLVDLTKRKKNGEGEQ